MAVERFIILIDLITGLPRSIRLTRGLTNRKTSSYEYGMLIHTQFAQESDLSASGIELEIVSQIVAAYDVAFRDLVPIDDCRKLRSPLLEISN